jgi:molybdate transport system substrate-binding protein
VLNITTLLLILGLGTANARAASLTVFAAASLTDSLKEIGRNYQRKTGEKIDFNFAGSSLLARQIEEGAPADIFFSADEAWMNTLEKHGLIVKTTRKDRLSNSLVIVVPITSSYRIGSPQALTNATVTRLALADPKAVPAGMYAREYLEKLHLWEQIAPKVVPMSNVRAALAAVASGDAEAGIVYKTDAAISKEVMVDYEVPPQEGPKISYPLAVLKNSSEQGAATTFLNYLESDQAGKVFKKYGFIVENATP